MVAAGVKGGAIGVLVFIGYRVSVGEDEKVLEMDGGDCRTHCCRTMWT